MSTCQAPKPRSTLRPRLPCVPAGAAVNAAGLKILPPGYCDPKSSRGTPGFMFGRGARATPATKKVPPTMSTGGPDLAKMKLSSDQSRSTVRTSLCDSGEGRSSVMPAVNECRISKVESPRSTCGLAIELGVLTFAAAVSDEAISIECENEYDAIPCSPRDKRL